MSRPISIEEMVSLFKFRHRTSHMFKIDNFSLLAKYQIQSVQSSTFDLGDHKLKLHVYPNGNKQGSDKLTVVLEKQASTNLEFELFIVSQLEPNWLTIGKTDFGASSTTKKKGIAINLSLADLETKGYLMGDCCMFGVNLYKIKPAVSGTAECFSLIEKPLNHKVTWKMTKFSSFEPDRFHCSNEFVVGTRKWRIKVHPRGFKGEKDKSFSVFLSGEGFISNAPKTQTFAKFKLRVVDQFKRNHFEKPYSDWLIAEPYENYYGFADFMPLEKLKEPYLVNDEFYVGVEFEVISMTTYC